MDKAVLAGMAAQANLIQLENTLTRPLAASIALLRQIQSGMPVDPELARETADAGIAALDDAGLSISGLWGANS